MSTTNRFSKAETLTKIRGQELRVKGLRSAFAGWPFTVSPALEHLRADVKDLLDSLYSTNPKLRGLHAADFGHFGAAFWPHVSLERLRVVTYLNIWLFIWDDETDGAGRLSSDFALAEDFRSQTLRHIRLSLGLEASGACPNPTNAVIRGFDFAGKALRESYTTKRRERMMKEMSRFIEATAIEHRAHLSNGMPSCDAFWQLRRGTIGVRVSLAVLEYCNEAMLPSSVMQSEDMAKLWDLVTVNIIIVNDLLSLKKELASGYVDSLVPILAIELGSMQKAIAHVMDAIRANVQEFDVVANRILGQYVTDVRVVKSLQRFVDGCRYMCTGNITWSLSTARYGLGIHPFDQDDFAIQL